MAMGRPPKPTHLKLLEGNPGKRAVNRDEPKPAVKAPSCPRHLIGEARREWKRISRELLALKLLSEVDRAALAAYCQAWARWVYAEEKINRLLELETEAQAQGEALIEAAKTQVDALAAEAAYLNELGMASAGKRLEKQLERIGLDVERIARDIGILAGAGGLIAVTDKGFAHASPWIQISNLAVKQMKAFLVEFGMTPASRSRVVVPKGEDVDPYEAFRKRKNGTTG